MSESKVGIWIQAVTGIAVVIGLGMVMYELKQTQDLTRHQLSSDGYINTMDTLRVGMGESHAATLAKACFEPENLTNSEMFEMLAFYEIRLFEIQRMYTYAGLGEENIPWHFQAKGVIGDILQTQVGRAVISGIKRDGGFSPEVLSIIDEIKQEGVHQCHTRMGRIIDDARRGILLKDV